MILPAGPMAAEHVDVHDPSMPLPEFGAAADDVFTHFMQRAMA